MMDSLDLQGERHKFLSNCIISSYIKPCIKKLFVLEPG